MHQLKTRKKITSIHIQQGRKLQGGHSKIQTLENFETPLDLNVFVWTNSNGKENSLKSVKLLQYLKYSIQKGTNQGRQAFI